MRRKIKQELLQIMQTLQEAKQQIYELLQAGDTAALQQFLADCQDVAVEIGSVIDANVGEGTSAVTALENYCEGLYNVFLQGHVAFRDLQDRLKVAVDQIERLTEKYEIVFFPYKAAMWDSLESIWLAAKEDERCECYVVPIPYFEKKSDGTLGEMHYEGDLFPEYVPVTDWKEYDLIQRSPEMAYIHNPYDNGNHVTSVHPFYYAKELKKYVGKLIYCPYFVSGETVEKHYCTLPGVLWADKVIVQSEHIRKQYIRYYDEAVAEPQIRNMWGSGEEKFVALGSPKVDKVRFYEQNQGQLPEEWRKLCEGKKIVFYNTHLTESLRNGENFFEKLRDVLAYFEQNETYVLWWRPHPLSEQSMVALRPELLREYGEIVREYRKKGYGIFDDTPEWYRAVAWADVYYGSGGSLLPLFGVTGKPVILQDTKCLYTEFEGKKGLVNYDAFIKTGDTLYLISCEMGVLVSLNLRTEECKLEVTLPNELVGNKSVFNRMFIEENKIYIFIGIANAFYIYYIKERQLEEIEWKNFARLWENSDKIKFAEVLCYKQYFIMIPHKFDAILLYNKENGELTCHTEWINKLEELITDLGRPKIFFRINSACMVEDKVFAVLRRAKRDVVCCFTVPDMRLEQIYYVPQEGALRCLEYDGKNLWMLHEFGDALIKWDYQSNNVQIYQNPVLVKKLQESQYRLIQAKGHIYLYPIKPGRSVLCLMDERLIEIDRCGKWYKNYVQVDENMIGMLRGENLVLEWKNQDWCTQQENVLQWPEVCGECAYKEVLLRERWHAFLGERSLKYIPEGIVLQLGEWLYFFDISESKQVNQQEIMQKYATLFSISSQSAGSMIHDYIMSDLED